MKLTPDFKARWLAALRSDEFRQHRGALASFDSKQGTAYCCVGVAYVVAQRDGMLGDAPELTQDTWGRCVRVTYNTMWGALAEDFIPTSPFDTIPEVMRLTRMNDMENKSFAQIANVIEKDY